MPRLPALAEVRGPTGAGYESGCTGTTKGEQASSLEEGRHSTEQELGMNDSGRNKPSSNSNMNGRDGTGREREELVARQRAGNRPQ